MHACMYTRMRADTDRHRHRHRQTQTDTDRQTDRQTQTHTDTHTHTHTHTHTERHTHTLTVTAMHGPSRAQSVEAGVSVLGCCHTYQVGRSPAACTPKHIVGRPGLQQRQHCMWGCWSHMQWCWKYHHQDHPVHKLHNLSAPLQATSSAIAASRLESTFKVKSCSLS